MPSAPPSAGSSRRYQVNAVHTSKACNVISKYTAFVPVDINKSRYLPTVVGYPNSGKADAGSSQWAGGGGWGAKEPRPVGRGGGKGLEVKKPQAERV